MKLATKWAGVCGCGAYVLIGITSYFKHPDPWLVLGYGLGGSFLAGLLGYHVGNILANPTRSKNPKPQQAKINQTEPLTSVSGDETFLEDLDSNDATPQLPENASQS